VERDAFDAELSTALLEFRGAITGAHAGQVRKQHTFASSDKVAMAE
jgi:hypothetical protein